MSWRVIAAVVRVEFIRSRAVLLWGVGPALLAAAAIPFLDGSAEKFTAVFIGLALFASTMLAPIGTLGMEKMTGTLEFDRTLPLPVSRLAAARLIAAALRTLPLLLLPASIAIIFAKSPRPVGGVTIGFAVVAVQLLYWSGMWIGYGLVSRFDLKRLVWAPAIIWLVAVLIPGSALARAKNYLAPRLSELVTGAITDSSKLPMLGLVLLGVAVVAFVIALVLVTSGLRRFVPNPMALQTPMEKVPREELVARGRGVVLAQTGLRLRLATPQIRRELIFVAVMVAVLTADSLGVTVMSALPAISRTYLPILGLMMPGAIAIQLIAARSLGTLEGLQQLPHPRRAVALGHLLAIATLAVPGTIIWSITRAFEGVAVEPTRLLSLAFSATAVAWFAAAVVVWGTIRRVLILGVVTIGMPFLAIFGGGWLIAALGIDLGSRVAPLFALWAEQEAWLKPTMVILLSVLLVGVSTILFTYGLKTLQPKRN